MTIYRDITLMDGWKKLLHEDDVLTHVPGGVELTFHSSPSITTFYPYHRINSITTTDTDKAKARAKARNAEDGDELVL